MSNPGFTGAERRGIAIAGAKARMFGDHDFGRGLGCLATLLVNKALSSVMEFEGLSQNLEHLRSSGVVLSVEKKASLQLSLVLLQKDQKLRRVKFWGVIRGIQNDYYIVQGVGADELKDIQSFYRCDRQTDRHVLITSHVCYSRDCIQWNVLPHVDDGLKRKSALLQGRFTGDPSYVNEHTVTQKVGEGESVQEETTTVSPSHCLLPLLSSLTLPSGGDEGGGQTGSCCDPHQ